MTLPTLLKDVSATDTDLFDIIVYLHHGKNLSSVIESSDAAVIAVAKIATDFELISRPFSIAKDGCIVMEQELAWRLPFHVISQLLSNSSDVIDISVQFFSVQSGSCNVIDDGTLIGSVSQTIGSCTLVSSVSSGSVNFACKLYKLHIDDPSKLGADVRMQMAFAYEHLSQAEPSVIDGLPSTVVTHEDQSEIILAKEKERQALSVMPPTGLDLVPRLDEANGLFRLVAADTVPYVISIHLLSVKCGNQDYQCDNCQLKMNFFGTPILLAFNDDANLGESKCRPCKVVANFLSTEAEAVSFWSSSGASDIRLCLVTSLNHDVIIGETALDLRIVSGSSAEKSRENRAKFFGYESEIMSAYMIIGQSETRIAFNYRFMIQRGYHSNGTIMSGAASQHIRNSKSCQPIPAAATAISLPAIRAGSDGVDNHSDPMDRLRELADAEYRKILESEFALHEASRERQMRAKLAEVDTLAVDLRGCLQKVETKERQLDQMSQQARMKMRQLNDKELALVKSSAATDVAAKARIRDLEDRNGQLNRLLKQAQAKTVRPPEPNAKSDANNALLRSNLDCLRKSHAQLTSQRDSLKKRIATDAETIDQLRLELRNLQTAHAEQLTQLLTSSATAELSRVRSECEQLRANLTGMAKQKLPSNDQVGEIIQPEAISSRLMPINFRDDDDNDDKSYEEMERNEQQLKRCLTERDRLLRMTMYTVEDPVIKRLDMQIAKLQAHDSSSSKC